MTKRTETVLANPPVNDRDPSYLLLEVLEKKTPNEVAHACGVSASTVKRWRAEAQERIKAG
jgi:DNA-directed RNA polymerase specialized sigma24 family protein